MRMIKGLMYGILGGIIIGSSYLFMQFLFDIPASKKQMPIVVPVITKIVKDREVYMYLYKNEKGENTYITYEDSNLYQIGDTLFKK